MYIGLINCIDGLNFSLFPLWVGHSALLLDSGNILVI